MKKFGLGLLLGVVVAIAFLGGRLTERKETVVQSGKKEIVDEESVVTKVVEEATPSVVTVSISKTTILNANPFDIFGDFG